MAEVYINSNYFGKVEHPEDFVQQVRDERRANKLSKQLNIRYHKAASQVLIDTSAGRLRRPLFVLKDGKLPLTKEERDRIIRGDVSWSELVDRGVVEYLDANEEEDALVAFYEHELTPDHTHLEIAPVGILSMSTSLVPFANYSMAAYTHHASKMLKQALGLHATNFLQRLDSDSNVLYYPQVPLVRSSIYDFVRESEHPAGQNVVVAVLSFDGYNMDDSIIVNQGSVDRGFARSAFFRPYVVEELRYSGGLVDEIAPIDKEVKGYKSEHDYRFLEDDGVAYVGAQAKGEDILVGKTSPPRFLSGMDEYTLGETSRRESSEAIRHGEDGVVDFVVMTENGEGNKLVQMRVRDERIPEIGDKFASRSGQKGVIGMIFPQADMPFSVSGIVPDVIFSPHSIPSRMTISHLLELIGGKVAALSGRTVDATPFEGEKEDPMRQELLAHGFRDNGTETLINGITGKQFQARIYIGVQYYQKLRYMVANKLQCRATGPVALLTRQPTEGRSKEGGLRLGEMEKDTLVAHGAALLLKERIDSDKVVCPVCTQCGLIAVEDNFKNRDYCSYCGENTEISRVEMSYAFKLLLDELKSMLIYPKISLKSQYAK